VRLVGICLKRGQELLELGKLNRRFTAADRRDQLTDSAERNLLRRRSQRPAVKRGITRFAHLAVLGKKVSRRRIERCAGPAQTARRQRKRFGRQSERRERVDALPQPRAFEAWIGIARVANKRNACLIERGDKPRLWHIEQRPQNRNPRPSAFLRNRRQAIESAAAS